MPDSAWWDKVRADRDAPKYWQSETSGILREPIRKYLESETLTLQDLALLRAYIRQWIDSPVWDDNPHQMPDGAQELQQLRQNAKSIRGRADIDRWLEQALRFGVDPL